MVLADIEGVRYLFQSYERAFLPFLIRIRDRTGQTIVIRLNSFSSLLSSLWRTLHLLHSVGSKFIHFSLHNYKWLLPSLPKILQKKLFCLVWFDFVLCALFDFLSLFVWYFLFSEACNFTRCVHHLLVGPFGAHKRRDEFQYPNFSISFESL